MALPFHPQRKPRPRLLVRAEKRQQRAAAAKRLRAEVRGRDGHQCQCCHLPVFVNASNPLQRAQVHHIQYRSQGGPNEHRNLVTVCAECHARIHAHDIEVVGTNAMNVRFIRKRTA
jgi:5-methylcytosine-specific restriction endonuclease McrA